MNPLAALTILSLSLSAAPTCPEGGETVFFQVDRGFQGFRLIGGDSYRSFFAGRTFERATSARPSPSGRAEFWVDEVLAQWMLVGRDAFLQGEVRDGRALLEAFYRFQTGTLAGAGATGAATLGAAQAFEPLAEKGADGKVRLFQIWKSALGKESEATQFWVATPHPLGVVVLSVIAPSAEVLEKARSVIQSYMFNFGPIDAAGCGRLRAEGARKK
jgi:hypothetical protein